MRKDALTNGKEGAEIIRVFCPCQVTHCSYMSSFSPQGSAALAPPPHVAAGFERISVMPIPCECHTLDNAVERQLRKLNNF